MSNKLAPARRYTLEILFCGQWVPCWSRDGCLQFVGGPISDAAIDMAKGGPAARLAGKAAPLAPGLRVTVAANATEEDRKAARKLAHAWRCPVVERTARETVAKANPRSVTTNTTRPHT